MGKGVIKFILFTLILSAASGVRALASEELPSYETFAAQLPAYTYDCNVERFFAEPNVISALYTEPNLQESLKVKHVPTNAQFNKILSEKIPPILYESLKKLHVLNPSLAENIYSNLKREPLRFQCSHLIAKYNNGSAATIRKRWYWWGIKSINLAAFVASLINESEKSNHTYLNRSLFHEVLHYFVLENESVDHAENVEDTGARYDVVYSCANFTWKPTVKIDSELKTHLPAADNESSVTYLNKVAYKKRDYQGNPNQYFVHVFHYDQCMTCALARVEDNRLVRSQSAEETESAEKFCKVIAPKVNLQN